MLHEVVLQEEGALAGQHDLVVLAVEAVEASRVVEEVEVAVADSAQKALASM